MTYQWWSWCSGSRKSQFVEFRMLCDTSRHSCFYFAISSLSINFVNSVQGQTLTQNGMYWTIAYPNLICRFLDSDLADLSDQNHLLDNDLIISACWRFTWTWLFLHQFSTIFEMIVLLFNMVINMENEILEHLLTHRPYAFCR